MFPLYFHYEDVSRQDPLPKPNHANVMEVPGLCEIRVVPKAPCDLIIINGKLAMEIPCGQKFIQTPRGSTGKSFRSNPFLGSNKDKGYVSDLARQSTLRNWVLRILPETGRSFWDLRTYSRVQRDYCHFGQHTRWDFTTVEQLFAKRWGGNLVRC